VCIASIRSGRVFQIFQLPESQRVSLSPIGFFFDFFFDFKGCIPSFDCRKRQGPRRRDDVLFGATSFLQPPPRQRLSSQSPQVFLCTV
jgi:hypothetical protein